MQGYNFISSILNLLYYNRIDHLYTFINNFFPFITIYTKQTKEKTFT